MEKYKFHENFSQIHDLFGNNQCAIKIIISDSEKWAKDLRKKADQTKKLLCLLCIILEKII